MSPRMAGGQILAPSAADLERIAEEAVSQLAPLFQGQLDHVVLKVEEFADEETLAALEIDDPFDLSGLYRGRSIDQRSQWDSGDLPSMIHLYRRPILDEWIEREIDLADLVRHVVIHEVGHHFGFSDADMARIEEDGA